MFDCPRPTVVGVVVAAAAIINLIAVQSERRMIFFSTRHGRNFTPRIESVSLDVDDKEKVIMETYGYGCQSYYDEFEFKRNRKSFQLVVKSMSYDEVSKKLFIQTTTDGNRFTLLAGDPCRAVQLQDSCQELREKRGDLSALLSDTEEEEFNSKQSTSPLVVLYREAKSPDSARVGPFSSFQNRIFFVLQRLQLNDFKVKSNTIQIRELVSRCLNTNLKFPIFATDSVFDLMECSLLVAELVHETFDHTQSFWPLDVLLILPCKDGLDFFHQLLQASSQTSNSPNSSDVKTIVYLYRASNYSKTVNVLHYEQMDSSYIKYVLLQLGGISHSNGFLCWAPLDRIVCGLWSGKKMTRVRTHLGAKEASKVCKAFSVNPELRFIITGVAVSSASVGGEISLYFGCVAQVAGMGGFGFLRSPESGGPPIELMPINLNDEPVQAGGLIFTNHCSKTSAGAPSYLIDAVALSSVTLPLLLCTKFSPL